MELRQLKPAVAVRDPHHRDVDSNAVEPVDTVHPWTLNRRLALQLHTKFDKERDAAVGRTAWPGLACLAHDGVAAPTHRRVVLWNSAQ
jgi:hypothetical protein